MFYSPTPPKFEYRPTPYRYDFKGLDLKIDQQTQKLCETYNQSSGATRSVLYTLLIVCVISLVAVFNSNNKFNWTRERIGKYRHTILAEQDSLRTVKAGKRGDSLKLFSDIHYAQQNEDALIHANIDNNDTIKASFIGIAIDTFDLASLAGLSLTILFIVLRFTMIREKNNLKIALHSISERYTDDADYDDIKLLAGTLHVKLPDDVNWDHVVTDFNFIRRRYHYNFLSMNDVFNLPLLDTSDNDIQGRLIGRVINKYLFYFYLLIYSYIILNDFCSYKKAWAINPGHTLLIALFSGVFYVFIFNICLRCVNQKKVVYKMSRKFWERNYTFQFDAEGSYLFWPYRVGIALGLLGGLYVISVIVHALGWA